MGQGADDRRPVRGDGRWQATGPAAGIAQRLGAPTLERSSRVSIVPRHVAEGQLTIPKCRSPADLNRCIVWAPVRVQWRPRDDHADSKRLGQADCAAVWNPARRAAQSGPTRRGASMNLSVIVYAGAHAAYVDLSRASHFPLSRPVEPNDLMLDDPESRRLREGFLFRYSDGRPLVYQVLLRNPCGRYFLVGHAALSLNQARRVGATCSPLEIVRHSEVSKAIAKRLLRVNDRARVFSAKASESDTRSTETSAEAECVTPAPEGIADRIACVERPTAEIAIPSTEATEPRELALPNESIQEKLYIDAVTALRGRGLETISKLGRSADRV